MKRFQYGVREWSLRVRGNALCRLASEKNLDCLQLGVGTEVFRGGGLGSPALIGEYQKACEEYGISVHSLSPQFVDEYSFTMTRGVQEEQTAVKLVERTIELCTVFGCGSFLLPVLMRNGICDGASFHRAVEYIKRFSHIAAEKGIETYIEMNQTAEQVRNLLDAVGNPMVKVFFDSQNLYAEQGTAMAGYFRELEDVIGGVHLKDGEGTMLSGSLLGEGTSGFYKTARAILESSYSGCLIIESVYSKPTVSPLGNEAELLGRVAAALHRIFDGYI